MTIEKNEQGEDVIVTKTSSGVVICELYRPAVDMQPTTRRVSKLGFVGRLGDDYRNILLASKASVDLEMFVRMLDWATPEADGTSVDLDDTRVVGALQAIEAAGVIASGRAAEILA